MSLSRFLGPAFLLTAVVFGTRAQAALVTTTFRLDPVTATTNRLALNLLTGADTTDLTGEFQATLEIDQVTGVVSSLQVTSAASAITATDWSMNVAGVGLVAGLGTRASVNTPPPADPVNMGNFNAAAHNLILDAGTVTLGGALVQDFGPNPLTIPGIGTGSITSTMDAGVFDLKMTLPINSTQTITPPGVDLIIVGNLVASGQVAMVPEPTSGIALLGLSLLGVCTHRRRNRLER